MATDVTWGCDASKDKQDNLAHAVVDTLTAVQDDLKGVAGGVGDDKRNALLLDAMTLASPDAVWSAQLFGILGIISENILRVMLEKGSQPRGELCVLYCAARLLYRKAYDDGFKAAMSMWEAETKKQ